MSGGETPATPSIRITSGNPGPEEIAALTAVLTAALDQLAGESRREGQDAPDAWGRSRRALRTPLPRGDWRGPTR